MKPKLKPFLPVFLALATSLAVAGCDFLSPEPTIDYIGVYTLTQFAGANVPGTIYEDQYYRQEVISATLQIHNLSFGDLAFGTYTKTAVIRNTNLSTGEVTEETMVVEGDIRMFYDAGTEGQVATLYVGQTTQVFMAGTYGTEPGGAKRINLTSPGESNTWKFVK